MWRWVYNLVQKKIQQHKKGAFFVRSKTLSFAKKHKKKDLIGEKENYSDLSDDQDEEEETKKEDEDNETRFARLEKVCDVVFSKKSLHTQKTTSVKRDNYLRKLTEKKAMTE